MGPTGAAALAEGLTVNSALTHLNLSSNELCGLGLHGRGTYTDIGVLALARVIQVSSALISLDLSCNEIAVSGAKALAEALNVRSALKNLNLFRNNLTRWGDDMSGILAIADALKSGTSALEELNLADNQLGEIGAAAVAGALVNSALTSLDLSLNDITSWHVPPNLNAKLTPTCLNLSMNNIPRTRTAALAEEAVQVTSGLTLLT